MNMSNEELLAYGKKYMDGVGDLLKIIVIHWLI